MRLQPLLMATCVLAGCSFSANTRSAEAQIDRFHQNVDAGHYAEIYSAADSTFRAATTAEDWNTMLNAIHTKLGIYRSGKTIGWTDNATPGGEFLTLNREAVFATGPAQEQFVFRIKGKENVLVGYHLNSIKLLAK